MAGRNPVNQTESMENYLEAIALLQESGKPVTVTAISKQMGVKKPSVDWALNELIRFGLVLHEKYGDVELTTEGARIARDVNRRHQILRRFLIDVLGVDPGTSDTDACRMEHVLSKESLLRLEKFVDFVLNCHPGLADWEQVFNRFVKYGKEDKEVRTRFTG